MAKIDPLNQEYMDALTAYLADGYGPGVCARLIRVQAAEFALNQRAFDQVRQAFVNKVLELLDDKG